MGDNLYILIFYSVIGVLVIVTFFLVLYIRNQNVIWQQRKQFQETEIQQQKQLLNAVIESQESERKRIGQDLHDEIGGTLSAMKLMLGALKQQGLISEDNILPVKELIDKMIKDVRHISHDLSPPGLAMFGLYTTIEAFVSLINNTGKIDIEIEHDPYVEERLLAERTELALFRVITQLIANSLKHAEATHINLSFKPSDTTLQIGYTDDGKGFDVAILNERKGIGMQNIVSRLQMVDAVYTLETSPGKGFKMVINCPLDKEAETAMAL
ncbi:histidine kinase [Pedobacter sp. KR3-3]|uniref:histidine kinase n=1 Tax=Pedobacter albus TaxID=3113905 RepID=A0ABU7I5Z8_9SPHI|nr:histidine kinase [Pedobacter sp. KR3-3]MEE1944892.1 histidine kinase [Pedobacter sp. KR3-3]